MWNYNKTIKQKLIRSTKHNIYYIPLNKIKKGVSAFDDKRCLVEGQTNTLPWD